MKIRCDVCSKNEASVFCSADEAALCDGCDRHVHYANKLAGKHTRFSLLNPSLKETPLCDICQVKRAFLFCQEDRAILCRECDGPIHRANEHTQKHNRFLLTGVKISSTCSSSSGCEAAIDAESRSSNTQRSKTGFNGVSSFQGEGSDSGSFSTSSISEYLEALPGWCVEDFLDPSHGFSKVYME